MADYATEAGHWYNQKGEPCYTIIGKNGKERPTTLRDARTQSLVPSVTSVLGVLDKPGLNRWKENQVLMAALTLPKIEGESVDSFAKRIKEDAQAQGKEARDKGTFIHGLIEKYFSVGADSAYLDKCVMVEDEIKKVFGKQKFKTERSFACPLGYGGKVDLYSDNVVLDIKTTEFTEKKLPPGYPEQRSQLAAYRAGLDIPNARVANVFISTSEDGLIYIKEWSEEELTEGMELFLSALNIWKILKKYDGSARWKNNVL